jgi:hypothetical protein
MKMSVYIDQYIGAEIFPYFPIFPARRQDHKRAIVTNCRGLRHADQIIKSEHGRTDRRQKNRKNSR